ncbi:MAG: alpha amylase C-terminal domain-containing protein [Bacteroidota bacterium]
MNVPGIIVNDPWLKPFGDIIVSRQEKILAKISRLSGGSGDLSSFASGHLYFGIHRTDEAWIFREWAPNASSISLIGEFNNWQPDPSHAFSKVKNGEWELILPLAAVRHGQRYKLRMTWPGGGGDRIPAWASRLYQNEQSKAFDAVVWSPPEPYHFGQARPSLEGFSPVIYEAHIGMGTEEEKVGSFNEFREKVLPRIVRAGYNTLQLMAIQEHPYYGSFGYHVSSFFAVSSRFGTPDDLKALIDEAHGHGLAVIMDLVHSHAVKNELEGLGNFAGDPGQFFHTGGRREHVAWDSLCFDYGNDQVIHFLLSNIAWWLTEYQFDGFRFDGITSMLYFDHGLGKSFSGYEMYFDGQQDEDAIIYLAMANLLCHQLRKDAITIAEDMSGYPGLATPCNQGGLGFNYRLAMGIPDYWIKTIKERSDENWNMGELYHELTSRRSDEKTVAYAESHDQALVGDKTIIFRLMDKEMYFSMSKTTNSLVVDRGIALHKMIRLITISTAGNGYLNFMGNEFGHPEWIDFPREGNNWSYKYARRQWSLTDNPDLKYHWLADFDREMIRFILRAGILGTDCEFSRADQNDLVIAFERNGYVFAFNFHPSKSYTGYGIAVRAGKYKTVLSTDDTAFGGYDRIDRSTIHRTFPEKSFGLRQKLNLYLPSRTGQVLKHEPIPKVR